MAVVLFMAIITLVAMIIIIIVLTVVVTVIALMFIVAIMAIVTHKTSTHCDFCGNAVLVTFMIIIVFYSYHSLCNACEVSL